MQRISHEPRQAAHPVVTGGEVLSLDIEMVKRILRLAKSCGLTTRIVTNAFWATTISAASLLMDELVHAGLDEINVSTGDVHQRFVPLKNILNVVRCAERVDVQLGIGRHY